MFGKKGKGLIKRRERDRLGIGYMTPIEIIFEESGDKKELTYNAKLNKDDLGRIDKDFVKRTSQQSHLNFDYDAKGKIEREENFWIKQAKINIFEELSEEYKVFLNLTLNPMSDDEIAKIV